MPEIRRWLRLTDHSQLMNYKTPIVINHLGTIKNFIRYFILHNYILQLMIIWICLCYSSIIVLWPWVIKMCCWNSSSGTTSSSAVRYISYLTTHVMRGGGSFKNTRNHTTMYNAKYKKFLAFFTRKTTDDWLLPQWILPSLFKRLFARNISI